MRGPKRDLTGNVYGMLTVIGMKQDLSKSRDWRCECRCECGNIHIVHYSSLWQNKTTSCGCRRDQYKKNTGKNSKQFTGYEGVTGSHYNNIRKGAIQRNINFNLTPKDLWELALKQNQRCKLTNLPLDFTNKNTTASLDRIDSTKGYELNNIQWVYKSVNVMKNVFETDYFISLCKLIADNSKTQLTEEEILNTKTNYGKSN